MTDIWIAIASVLPLFAVAGWGFRPIHDDEDE